MRGVFLHQQLEFRLEMPKDGVKQGDSLPCTLTVKNHGSAPQELSDVCLDLVCGDPKCTDANSPDLERVSTAEFKSPWSIAPQQTASGQWTFELDKNCTVSDKNQSLLFCFGTRSGERNLIPIVIGPHAHIDSINGLLESTFQFVLKGIKSSKGWVDVKFKPPSARRFSLINELVLGFRFDGEALNLKFKFNTKKFEGTEAAVKVGKTKSEVDRRLEEREYLSGGYINQETTEAAIESALSTVATGF